MTIDMESTQNANLFDLFLHHGVKVHRVGREFPFANNSKLEDKLTFDLHC